VARRNVSALCRQIYSPPIGALEDFVGRSGYEAGKQLSIGLPISLGELVVTGRDLMGAIGEIDGGVLGKGG